MLTTGGPTSGDHVIVTDEEAGSEDEVGICFAIEDPPPGVALFAGDFAHNLRSALDHLAWQLVIDNGLTPTPARTPDPRRRGRFLPVTEFPIWVEPRRPPRRGGAAPLPTICPGISAAAATIVQGEQPYITFPSDPDRQALGALRKLNNVDKHHDLSVVFGGLLNPWYVLSSPTRGLIAHSMVMGAVNAYTPFLTLPRTDVPDDMQVRFQWRSRRIAERRRA